MATKNAIFKNYALDGFKNKDHEIGSILSTLFNLDFKVYNTALVWIWFPWFILIKKHIGRKSDKGYNWV